MMLAWITQLAVSQSIPGSSAVTMSLVRMFVWQCVLPNTLQHSVVSYYVDMRVVFAMGEPMMLHVGLDYLYSRSNAVLQRNL